jgi:hypothetical protein
VPEGTRIFKVGVGIMPHDPPVQCFVDGAALYIDRNIPHAAQQTE